jgi:hypothetical protein
VIVAQHWPGSLISMLALKLPLFGGFFSYKFHRHFNPPTKHDVTKWHSLRDFCAPFANTTLVYLLSGHTDFLWTSLSSVPKGCQRVIVTVEFAQHASTRLMIQLAAAAREALLWDFGLHLLIIANSAVDGATNGYHMLGFGHDLGSQVTPTVETGLPCTLQHFLDGGVKGRFASVRKTLLPLLDKPAQAVLFHNGIVRSKGLFPCRTPEALVCAPSYKLKDRYFTCGLTMRECLRLHQLPLAMEPLLAGLNPGTPCPFEDSPSPEVYTLMFCQLWGTCVGGVHGIGRWRRKR